jgi:hypothetical protein
MSEQERALIPQFPFPLPSGYRWLVRRGLVGFEPHSPLQPWYFLPKGEAFSATERWPNASKYEALFAFARRQDCDDLACFSPSDGEAQTSVIVVHGWTPEGYEVIATHASIWDWLRSVVRDIEEWAELSDD